MQAVRNNVKTYLQPIIAWPIANRGQIKNIAGVAAFLGVLPVVYDIGHHSIVRQTAWLSLVLGAATSWPGVKIISCVMHKLYTDAQLVQAFGRDTNYAGNPLLLRHWVSLVSVAFAMPIIADTLFYQAQKMGSKFNLCDEPNRLRIYNISQTPLAIMVFVLTLFSRPVLHWGSQFASKAVR